MNDDQYNLSALEELKNNTLLLTTANDHLADDAFLIKIGHNIGRAVEILERDISALKKEYPGKFVNDVDTDSILEKIDGTAQRMLKPSREIKESHASGTLGREMEINFISIKKAVEDLRIKVRGSHTQRPGRNPATEIVNSFSGVFRSAQGLLISGAKILAGLIFIACVALAYLYLSMEKDRAYINEIAASSALIKEKEGQITKLEQERQSLDRKRITMKSVKEMTREEKVAALEIEVGIKKINDTIDQLEAEIAVQEKKTAENQDKLNELRKKTFYQKLMKR
jgi:hypothetical protein